MALAVRTNGSGSVNLINATWFNDIRDLLTGVMTDQPVSIANTVTAKKFIANGTLSGANAVVDFQQGFQVFSDNTASTFAGATSRLWFQAAGANGTQEMHLGPRLGSTALAGLRVLANNVIITANGSGSPGVFQVAGGVTTSLDGGAITTDGSGMLTGRVHGDGHLIVPRTTTSAAGPYVDFDVDTSNRRIIMYPANSGTDTNAYGFDFRWRAASSGATTSALYIRNVGGVGMDNGAITTDGSGNITTSGQYNFGTAVGGTQAFLRQTAGNLVQLSTVLSGVATGVVFETWNGSAGINAFSIGGQFGSAPSYADASGNLFVGSTLLFGSGVSGSWAQLDWDSVNHLDALWTPQSGVQNGVVFITWSGSAQKNTFGIGISGGAPAWVDISGNYNGPIAGGIPTTRNGAALSVPIYTGTTTPVNPPTGSIWIKA